MGGFLLGLVVGVVIGGAAVYALLRRPAPAASAPPSVAPERELAAPATPSPAPVEAPPAEGPLKPDDDVQQALDATKGLLDELEGRYRDRPGPAGDDDEAPPKRPRRRPRSPS